MNNFKKLRQEKGIKQIELADMLGIAQATLSGWETGRYQIDENSLFTVADYFNVTTDYLLGRTNEQTPPRAEKEIADEDIKFALFGGDKDITDAQFEEVKRFARFIKEREANDK